MCARFSDGRRGQTLIELLVVVALIALLIAALIPSMKRSMRMAASAVCKSNLQQIGLGLNMYRMENNGWLPDVEIEEDGGDAAEDNAVWFEPLYPIYLADPLVFRCPEDPFGHRMLRARYKLDDPFVGDYSSYGINSFILTSAEGFLANLDRHQPSRPLDTILLADIGPDYGLEGGDNAESQGPLRNEGLLMVDDGFDPFEGGELPAPWVTTRHGRGINILTLGGGVRDARTLETLQTPINRYYLNCAAGGCTLCRELRMFHYSFARDRLFWWTGPAPSE